MRKHELGLAGKEGGFLLTEEQAKEIIGALKIGSNIAKEEGWMLLESEEEQKLGSVFDRALKIFTGE